MVKYVCDECGIFMPEGVKILTKVFPYTAFCSKECKDDWEKKQND